MLRVPGALLVLVTVSGFLWAKTPESLAGKEDASNGPETIRQEDPRFYVRADVDHISAPTAKATRLRLP